jgi:transcription factor STE12
LERDLKREKMGMDPTTHIVGEPALSFTYDSKRSLYEQFSKAQGAREGESELETVVRRATEEGAPSTDGHESGAEISDSAMIDDSENEVDDAMGADTDDSTNVARKRLGPNGPQFLFTGSLFEGSPTYKQRRKKGTKMGSGLRKGSEDFQDSEYERGRSMGGASGSGRFSSLSRERRVPPPMHSSMMEEFGSNPNTDQAISAAEMFHKQARGELVPGDGVVRKPKPQPIVGEVGVFYSEGAPPPGQRLGMHMRGRSFDQTSGRESTQTRPLSAGYNTTTFAEAQAQSGQTPAAQAGLNAPGPMASGMAQYEAVSADGKVRAFVCPLYSCGRLFKRMEHLKRHLRTHTMERPFTCPQCNKKFSRSDNLTQHLRTHDRPGQSSVPGSSNGGSDWMDSGEDGDTNGEGSTSGESPQPGGVVESDDDSYLQSLVGFNGMGGLEMFGDNGAFSSMDMSHFNMLSGAGLNMSHLDPGMCEVEVQGGVQDVQGDEEGLLMQTGGANPTLIYRNHHQFHSPQPTASDGYYSGLSTSSDATSGLLFSSSTNSGEFPDSAQWINRPQPNSAYSTVSAPSPPPGSIPTMRNSNRSSISGSPGSYLRNMQPQQPHASSSSASSAYGDDYSASLSAPSHKQSFDHVPLFPPGMLENALASNLSSGNVGPMRRHRSMTPSLIRNGEPIRRPMTANSGEFQGGSPNSVNSSISSSNGAARGYHPYAYSNNNSRANSTHSSPQVHAVPLGGAEYPQIRSESRNSNYGGAGGVGALHEQMRQMMSMNVDPQNPVASSSSSIFGDNVFRTGSPASFPQTDSPAAFSSVDLPLQYPGAAGYMSQQAPQQQQQLQSAATMPVMSQYGAAQQQQSQYEGYYVQQPHATL